MARRPTPQGYLSSAQAAKILGCSVPMVYNYERSGQLEKKTPPGRKQGFFQEAQVRALAKALDNFFEVPIDASIDKPDGIMTFSQATPDDMDGVYDIAAMLFASTTSAEARKPLVKKCPQGNYIVKRDEKIVAYIHLQPLKHDRMIAFMKGEIRGKDITIDDLDKFEAGKSIELLVKSVGATKLIGATEETRLHNQRYFLMRLLRGTARELKKLGDIGVDINKIYATSETLTGIRMAYDAKMEFFGRPLGESRFRYVLDIQKSDLALLQPYKRALAEWKANHLNNQGDVA